ncbi:MAG TPA: PqqD family protein [Thermoanaerobaculia bacterium]|nr:PqqD family protein [Thermoanaerobaculia bacterium]
MFPSGEITIPKSVLFQKVGEEIVLLSLDSGVYFGLDPVGARIWELISEQKSLDEVAETIAAEYDAPRETIDGDLESLVKELQEKKLISIG